MTLTLQKMPEILPNYFKAALSVGRRTSKTPEIPALEASLPELRIDQKQLSAYREICGFAGGDVLPITFPQVLATSMQLHLMNQPAFPLPLMGLVHLRNRIEQERALGADEVFAVKVRVEAGGRTGEKGLEFDVILEFLAEERVVWRAVMTVLHRARSKPDKPAGKKPAAPASSQLSQYMSFDAPADIGRRYGRVSGDLNPIHLSPISAKLFGYPRAIAHGLWSLARCAALLEPQLGRPPRELDAAFKQPLFLPGRVALKHHADGDGLQFWLLSRTADKTHLAGSLR